MSTGVHAQAIQYLSQQGQPGTVPVSPQSPLPTTVVGGGGGGLSVQDQSAFTPGASNFTPGGCQYNSSISTLPSGDQGTFACSNSRGLIVDVLPPGNSSLATILLAPTPWISRTSELTPLIANGLAVPAAADSAGKLITSPYANRENYTRGAAALNSTIATTFLPASGSASLKEYITDLTCTRSDAGTTAVTITLNDTLNGSTLSTVFDLPNNGGGGGYSHTYESPLVVAANTAATASSSASIATIHCSASGFYGY